MDIRALQYFTRVVELGSITRAAAYLHVAQPALSRHVRHLEEELGAPLLIRESRGIRLTDHGRMLFDHAKTILRDIQRAKDEVRGSACSPSGSVALGLVPTVCPVIAPILFASLRRDHPRIELTMSENYSSPLLDWLNEGRIDLAVLTEPAPTRRFVVDRLVKEEMVLAAPKRCRAPGAVTVDELARTPVIISQGIRGIMDNLLGHDGPLLTAMIELNSIETIRLMVRQGIGAAVLPCSIVRNDAGRGDLTLHTIGNGFYRHLATAFARTRRLSLAAQTVKNTLSRLFGDLDREAMFRLAGSDGAKGKALGNVLPPPDPRRRRGRDQTVA